MSLSPESCVAGVVTSSTGNHGLAVAAAARYVGIAAEVVVSTSVPASKLDWIKSYGAKVRTCGENPLDAEIAAPSEALASGRTCISPYNDQHVVAGQGTIGAELCRQLENIDAVFVAVGGGGLIGGIGAYLNAVSPRTAVICCWPENSRVMYECLKAGHIIEFPETPTLSQSTTGGVEEGSITFDLCKKVITRAVARI